MSVSDRRRLTFLQATPNLCQPSLLWEAGRQAAILQPGMKELYLPAFLPCLPTLPGACLPTIHAVETLQGSYSLAGKTGKEGDRQAAQEGGWRHPGQATLGAELL